MQEHSETQNIPVKVYRTADRLMVAAPMAGMEPEDITVTITANNRILIDGRLRGVLKGEKELLIDEWSVGNYFRDLVLPVPVDGPSANVNYGNGVLVVAMLISDETRPATLQLTTTGVARGVRIGNAGQPDEAIIVTIDAIELDDDDDVATAG